MTKKKCTFIILAAGKGSRLNLKAPKALAPLNGQKLIDYCIQSFKKLEKKFNLELGIVLGHKHKEIEEYLEKSYPDISIKITIQKEQKGTAHALKCFFKDHEKKIKSNENCIVTCVDTPLVDEKIYKKILLNFRDEEVVCNVFKIDDPHGYGRVFNETGNFRIVEQKDCNTLEKKHNIVNSGIYAFSNRFIKNNINKIKNKNKSKEFYLTDVVLHSEKIKCINHPKSELFIGVNNQKQLSTVSKILLNKKIEGLQKKGVHLLDAHTLYIDHLSDVRAGTTIYPNVYIFGSSSIGEDCEIEPGVIIKDSIIQRDNHIKAYSYLEKCKIGSNVTIGPYARLRPETIVENGVKIGNFVEIKKSKMKKNSKASHLSYIGDAEIGENVNLGCGFITCNYDGKEKHKTEIGKNTFIGSDTQVIAPIKIGESCFIAAGSTITKDIEKNAMGIARSKQINKKNYAKKFLKHKDK